ncbi:MAG TPA: tRNA modification GTPase [Tepidisphaeraceae bacterium]|jgi:tRNA modification GTPase
MNPHDTIVAVSSAAGPAARLIVRLSGAEAVDIARSLCTHAPEAAWHGGAATRLNLTISDLNVPTWVYVFRGPRSYTGDDTVELHAPGNALFAQLFVTAAISAGARHAEAGEFTARAFLNGRLDLAAAEGVAATLAAENEAELRAARSLLSGELSGRLQPIVDELVDTLALLEAGIDFSEEDITFIDTPALRGRIERIKCALSEVLTAANRFDRLPHAPRLALVGPPNAGKSTLLNALAGENRAVVSDVAGTTRDVLSAEVATPRGWVTVLDVAGLETTRGAASAVEVDIARQMQQRARAAIDTADYRIAVIECGNVPTLAQQKADLVCYTQSDRHPDFVLPAGEIMVSARSGAGMDQLRERIAGLAFGNTAMSATIALNRRHTDSIAAAIAVLEQAFLRIDHAGPELIAHDLRDTINHVGKVLGRVTPDDVLGKIFAGFCIGK